MSGGRQIVSAAGDRTLKVWDVSTGKRLFTMTDALDALYAVAVHPSEPRLAAAGADRMIRTWAGLRRLRGVDLRARRCGASARLFARWRDARLGRRRPRRRIWDARTLRETQRFDAQPDWVMGLALSADGRWLAAGRYDGTLALYPVARDSAGEQFVVPR